MLLNQPWDVGRQLLCQGSAWLYPDDTLHAIDLLTSGDSGADTPPAQPVTGTIVGRSSPTNFLISFRIVAPGALTSHSAFGNKHQPSWNSCEHRRDDARNNGEIVFWRKQMCLRFDATEEMKVQKKQKTIPWMCSNLPVRFSQPRDTESADLAALGWVWHQSPDGFQSDPLLLLTSLTGSKLRPQGCGTKV